MPSDDAACRIFVGGLPAVTTDESLMQYFSQHGAVECTVMMDRVTGRSRGFGFVTLASPDMVTPAVSVTHIIDGQVVECRPCLVKTQPAEIVQEQPSAIVPAMTSPASSSIASAMSFAARNANRPLENKIFVGGLAPTTTTESMNAFFSQFGDADCIVMMDRATGRSRGFGFCTFETSDQVQLVFATGTARGNAVEHVLDGKVVSVKMCEAKNEGWQTITAPRMQTPSSGGDVLQQTLATLGAAFGLAPTSASSEPAGHSAGRYTQSRVFVGGLPQSCDDAKLHTFFSHFGTLTDAKVMMDRETGRSRGFGYVSFAEAFAMEAAIANGPNNVIDDKWIEVKRCEEKGAASSNAGQYQPYRPRGGAGGWYSSGSAPQHQGGGGVDLSAAATQIAAALQGLGQQQGSSAWSSHGQGAPHASQLSLASPQTTPAGAGTDAMSELTKALGGDPTALLTAVLTPVVQQLTQIRSAPY